MAKALAAIDILSKGRLLSEALLGSSVRDYEIVSINYAEKHWRGSMKRMQVVR